MKSIISILLIAMTFNTSAQKIKFTNIYNQWTTAGNKGPASVSAGWSYIGTQTIGSNVYNILLATYIIATGSSDLVDSVEVNVREDTINGIVYVYSPSGNDDTLMNYNAHIGDVTQGCLTVLGIGSTLINGLSYKVFSMQLYDQADASYSYYHNIEGIGGTRNPVYGAYGTLIFEPDTEYVTCFTTYDTTVYYYSPQIHVPGIFDNICVEGVNRLEKHNEISVYPNPAYNNLSISATNKITNITILNLLGQTVYRQSYNAPQVQVDIADLQVGIYFVKINGNEVQKFVKE